MRNLRYKMKKCQTMSKWFKNFQLQEAVIKFFKQAHFKVYTRENYKKAISDI